MRYVIMGYISVDESEDCFSYTSVSREQWHYFEGTDKETMWKAGLFIGRKYRLYVSKIFQLLVEFDQNVLLKQWRLFRGGKGGLAYP